jgi:hypothetical protein
MRRSAVLIIAVLAIASPLAAQEDARVLKGDARVPTVHDAPAGWGMQSLPIDPAFLAELRNDPLVGKKVVYIAATYASISEPDISGGIDAFDCMPLSFSRYYQGVVIFNLAGARTVNVKVKTTGASRQTMSGRFTLGANSITLIWGRWDAFGVGVVYFKTTVQGAKAVTSAVCSGC